jgi:O2-independent ubiquinone biosynthesis accessory factor UbiT
MQLTSTDAVRMTPRSWLRLLPPPRRFAGPLRLVPQPVQLALAQRVLAHVLSGPLADGTLAALEGRTVALEATDLDWRCVVRIRDARVEALGREVVAEAAVQGSVTDLLLLAARLEDADTLFFHRRLQVTGDVELGLLVRNLLDQLPWESVPLPLRIVLHRGAQLARDAREAHEAHRAPH